MSARETENGIEQAKQGFLIEADKSLVRASRLYPYADNILVSRADLYRHVLAKMPQWAQDERRTLFNQSRELLDEAQRLNPLRPVNFLVRGTLLQENPELAGEDWAERAASAFQHALRLNPRFYAARLTYAKFLLARDKTNEARQVLEDGMHYWYPEYDDLVPYFALTAKLRAAAGDGEGAKQLREKIDRSLKNSGWKWVPRPEQAKLLEARRNSR